MDEVDKKLLDLLKHDARLSFVELGSKVGLSEAAVRRRVKRLQELGIIKRFTIDIEVGQAASALTLVAVAPSSPTSEVSARIKALPAVQRVYEITGQYDIAVLITGTNIAEVNSSIDEIRRAEGVATTNTIIILREIT
jgi:Lrp/AsnC family leucine-responsive transcriptional regulator